MEQIIIHLPNGTARPLCDRKTATTITSAKQKREINNGDTVTMNIKSTNPQDFNIGDWIEVFGRVYRLNRLPKVKKDGQFGYSYDLEFEGVQYDLMRAMYNVNIDTTDNTIQDVTGDSLTGNLRRFLDVLVANANRVFPGIWSIGECPTDTDGDVTMTFGESDNCLAVLQSLCDKFKTEFDIDTTDGIHFAINMGKVGRTLPHAFIYGRGGGLYEITRENVSSSNVVTRLYAFGSTENITCKYHGTRLLLPGCTKATSFIENADALAIYGVCEATKYFDEKPTHTGTVTAVVNGDSLSFVDANFPFDINERDGVTTKYLIDGVAAKIHFNSGNLAGFEFEIHKYDHATHTFTLVKQTDERGNVFPSPTSAAFQIAQGNTYKIIDIAYPDTITQAAEQRLKATATEYLEQNCQPKVKYSVGITKQWLQRHASDAGVTNYFTPGDYVTVVDTGIGVNKSIRINAFERDILDPYNYKLTISDTVTTQLITRVISDAIETDKIIEMNDLKDPARARANWRSSREVLNMVFDVEGDYYTDKIKPESIDTMMLSVGAKSMQFGLVGVTIAANVQGNPNLLQITQGQLVHYAIEEQPRTWMMSPITISHLNASKAYYIYAQVARNGTLGNWVVSEAKIPYNAAPQAWTFLVGVLNSVDNTGTRTIYTMYGFTTINGRFIRTGRIQSADGVTYFDLDTGEIGGKITFKRNDGTTGNVADLDASNQATQDYINNTLPGLLGDLTDQIDGKIDTWYQEDDPSTAWTTNAIRAQHVGDMWYKASVNELRRYSSIYSWDLITDATAIAAYQAASQAQDTADGKRRVFTRQPTAADEYDEGDLWVNATCGQYIDELLRAIRHKDAGVAFSLSHWAKATRYTDNSELDNFINNTFNQVVADIQGQLDGQIEQFFETYDPTLQNEPAASWNAQDKENHLGDLFYNTENGKVFRFVKENGTYKWMQLQDEELAQALVLAQNAWDLADRKRTIFSSQPVPPYDIADLWVQGIDGDIMICIQARATGSFVATDWTKASKYTDDTALNNFVNTTFVNAINTLTTQIDGKIETWFTSTDPSSAWTTNVIRDLHIDDIWYNTSAKTLWHYVKVGNTYKWEQIVDQATIDAYEAASHAQDTADGKRRVFTDTPVPPYDAGDLWVQGGNGDIMVCVTPRAEGQSYNANDWKKASKYTDDSALRSFIDTTFTNAIGNLTEQIDGKIETWFTPTNPASAWETDDERAKHVDDIWYNTSAKTLWHYTRTQHRVNGTTFNYTYEWEQIVDQATIDAYEAASHAQDTADGKRRVFTDTPVPPYDAGDLWVQGGNGDIMVCRTTRTSGAYNASDWVKASKYTDDAALNDFITSTFNPAISDLSSQVDGKIEVWFTNVDPSTSWTTNAIKTRHIDDIWYNTSEKTLWHYVKMTANGIGGGVGGGISVSMFRWAQITDAQAIAAYEAASAAQDTADGKRTVFVAQPTNEDAYDPGDLWVNCNYNQNGVTYHNDLLRCVTAKAAGAAFSITHWALATAYDNTKTTIDGGVVTSGTIRLAGDDTTIKAGITGNGTGDESIRIWAGATEENKAVAPFRVYQDGSFVANNATITGIINAITGNIGNLRINGNYLSGYDDNGNERVRIGIGDLPSTSAAFVTKFVNFDIQSDDQDAHIVDDGQYGGWVQRIGHWDYSGREGHDDVDDTRISFYTEFRITETPTKLAFEDICLTSPSSSGVIATNTVSARLKFRPNTSSAWTTIATTYDANVLCQNGRWEVSHGQAGYFRLEVNAHAYPQDTVWQGVLQLGCRGIIVTLSPSVSLPNMTMIASDGILCTQGTNKYMRFSGSYGFEVRNGNQGFRVTATGVQKLITSTGGSQTWKDVLPTS